MSITRFIGGITFCSSNMRIDNFEEFNLFTNDYLFRKATPSEIAFLKNELDKVQIFWYQGGRERKYFFEYDFEEIIIGTTTTHEKIELDEKEFKYWVIDYNKTNSEISNLVAAISLLKNSFELNFHFIRHINNPEKISMLHSDFALNNYQKMETDFYDYEIIRTTMDEIKDIPRIYELYINNHKKYDFIEHAFINYEMLKRTNEDSDLLVLGYFSIIEMLITHPPREKENLDSISHQILNKLNLLEDMFERKIVYSEYFQETKNETIWKKLYAFRSDIAHGNIPDFYKKYSILNEKENIYSFLNEVIKNLLLFSLKEGTFLSKLKKC